MAWANMATSGALAASVAMHVGDLLGAAEGRTKRAAAGISGSTRLPNQELPSTGSRAVPNRLRAGCSRDGGCSLERRHRREAEAWHAVAGEQEEGIRRLLGGSREGVARAVAIRRGPGGDERHIGAPAPHPDQLAPDPSMGLAGKLWDEIGDPGLRRRRPLIGAGHVPVTMPCGSSVVHGKAPCIEVMA